MFDDLLHRLGTPEYEVAIVHRFLNGISEVTRYVVEPGNEMELRGLMELLAEKKIPFGLKSGGHISVPKIYPPNEGVLIYMKQFDHIKYDKEKKTLDVGAGVIWKDVYEYLEPFASDASDHAPGVVGGDPLVGVSGWLLGGGFSLQTNKFGLGIDNLIGFQVLLPGAQAVCNVSREENPEIFKALKGGGHNFGIITQFTMRVHDYAKRTAPVISTEFPESESSIVKDFLVRFIQHETRPEAVVVVAAFRHDLKDGTLESFIPLSAWNTDSSLYQIPRVSENRDLAQFFFSGDPSSMSLAEAYEAFSLRHLPVSLKTLQTDSHFVQLDASSEITKNMLNADLIERYLQFFGLTNEKETKSIGALLQSSAFAEQWSWRGYLPSTPDLRGRMACIMVTTYTRTLIDEAEKHAKVLSLLMAANQGIRVSFEIWPFHKNAFNGVRREESAWPHGEGKVFGPLVGWFEWSGKDNDKYWLEKISNSLKELRKVALKENCTTENLPMYLNITLEDTSVKDIYRDHYEELKRLRRKYDPNNVMGLAAGFVI
ncbi:hypothetical protein JOM56_007126 [Amanita muscaria]